MRYMVEVYWIENTILGDTEIVRPVIVDTIEEAWDARENADKKGARAYIFPLVTCCGDTVMCNAFTNTCPNCGRDYNRNGDELAPREQWGEETGECWSDCY